MFCANAVNLVGLEHCYSCFLFSAFYFAIGGVEHMPLKRLHTQFRGSDIDIDLIVFVRKRCEIFLIITYINTLNALLLNLSAGVET